MLVIGNSGRAVGAGPRMMPEKKIKMNLKLKWPDLGYTYFFFGSFEILHKRQRKNDPIGTMRKFCSLPKIVGTRGG